MTGRLGRLAVVVTTLWGVLLLVGQVLADPPLSTVVTVTIGVVLTNAAVLGYGSVLRGPRHRLRRTRRASAGRGDHAAAVISGQLPYLRDGLTSAAAMRTVRLLQPLIGGDAVAITDLEKMLAFVGPGADHHGPGYPLRAPDRQHVIATGEPVTLVGRERINCEHPGCPLTSAVIAPLHVNGAVAGTVSVYRTSDEPPGRDVVEGMAGILSLHLELAELEARSRLSADARLEALRAQINPHFLFNTLNTIASKVRTDPEEGRALLVRLADFFRYAIRQHGQYAEFAQEFFFVRTYVSLEQARFGDDLQAVFDVDPQVLGVEVPVLVIQPLVENAIKHGLSRKVGRGTVTLRARVDLVAREIDIVVRDDGVGMDAETLRTVLDGQRRTDASGVGVSNISERLALLYGQRAEMDVRSQPEDGTTVRLRLPLR